MAVHIYLFISKCPQLAYIAKVCDTRIKFIINIIIIDINIINILE